MNLVENMLTSPRKLKKLFIKFVSWGAIQKAKNLIELHPLLDLPLQKAFEESLLNSCIRSAVWIIEIAHAKGVIIDIHGNDDNLMKQLVSSEKVEQIRWLIKFTRDVETICQWRDRLNLEEWEQTPGRRKLPKYILELFAS